MNVPLLQTEKVIKTCFNASIKHLMENEHIEVFTSVAKQLESHCR